MVRDIPMRIFLVIGILVAGIIPLFTLSTMTYTSAKEELIDYSFKQLDSTRKLKKNQIEHFYSNKISQIILTSKNPFVIESLSKAKSKKIEQSYYNKIVNLYGLHELSVISNGQRVKLLSKSNGSRCVIPTDVVNNIVGKNSTHISDTFICEQRNALAVQAISSPINLGNGGVSKLIFLITTNFIDEIMEERVGMGLSGESYLVGEDYKMRSNSFLDPKNRTVLKSLQGSISKNGVKTKASVEGLNGKTKNEILVDYNGNEVLSSYSPLSFFDNKWVIIAEIDLSEIDSLIAEAFNRKVIITIVLAVAVLLLLALSISGVISSSVQGITKEIKNVTKGVLSGKLSRRVRPSSTSKDFESIMLDINQMIESLELEVEEKSKLEKSIQYNKRLEAIGSLTSGIAHDFNNILTYMFSYVDIVTDNLDDSDENKEFMEEISSAMYRAKDLVGQIMNFSKRVSNDFEPTDMGLVVKEAVKLIKTSLPKNIDLSKELCDEKVYIKADSTQLHQVIMNLCTNSYHALLDSGGQIKVRLQKITVDESEYARLTISDNGPGISSDIIEQIFDPFFTTKPQGMGSGMGLSVTSKIIKNLGGSIEVKSTPFNLTEFEINIPATMNCVNSSFIKNEIKLNQPGINILLVDDEEKICNSSRYLLSKIGCSVTTFLSPVDALKHFSEFRLHYDVVISDYNMPEMDGISFLESVSDLDETMPVVLSSAVVEKLLIFENIQGQSYILKKPYSKNDLISLFNLIFQ